MNSSRRHWIRYCFGVILLITNGLFHQISWNRECMWVWILWLQTSGGKRPKFNEKNEFSINLSFVLLKICLFIYMNNMHTTLAEEKLISTEWKTESGVRPIEEDSTVSGTSTLYFFMFGVPLWLFAIFHWQVPIRACSFIVGVTLWAHHINSHLFDL